MNMQTSQTTETLLIKTVKPIGFHADLPPTANGCVDILIGSDGLVLEVAAEIRPTAGVKVIEGNRCWLSPGWTDLHTHIWYGGTDISIKPEICGLSRGVTTLVDAGSAGEANFHGLRELIIDHAREDIFAFLNLGSIGLVACNRVSELTGLASVDIDRIAATVEANRDLIVGLKVRASGTITAGWDIAPVKLAKKLGRIFKLPIMVHVGEPLPLYDDVLRTLGEGDIITHCFNGKIGGSILEDEELYQLVEESQRRGIVLDVGHGGASFSFDVARAALSNKLLPDTISTDIHKRSMPGSVWDMSTTMSKLLSLGMPLEDVIAASSTTPRRVINRPHAEKLQPGIRANFTAFELNDSDLIVKDSKGIPSALKQVFDPRFTVLGAHFQEASRYQPAQATQRCTCGAHP
ncbi:amidohydrolase/deacetylase family metallohydrolase [Enterobacteriaceae bacterium H11S18]|uniref:amidohydrolase/deacetylase family metallohydrolase n=1 Tax=Dryocola clanedunensis TaxID=2925396 RepID=UPI0022EFFC97|nr:amidohydrolase/deacetylase family metallohydrolase [Dryocola clanedunensis]MCT4713365.1 amidohydrolase/deacetylase family metallohydrolase [Dryocola clanedunensis]